MAAGEHTYGWSQRNTSQGGPYGEHYGQPQGAQTITVVLEGSAEPWRACQDTQQQPSLRNIEMDPMSYPPPDMLRPSSDTNTDYTQHVPPYQQEQQVSTLQLNQPYTLPVPPQPQQQPPCAPYYVQDVQASHNHNGSSSRSPSEFQPDRGSDRDRDRRERDRDREREREYSGRYASSSADYDSGRERDSRRHHHDSREREHDRDRDRREDSRSSRRSRSPDHRQRNRSQSRNRSDYRHDDRQDRDRGGYDRSRYRDDERHDRDRSRDDRDRRDDRHERRYSRDEDDSYGRRRYPSRMDQELEAGLDGHSGDGRRSRSADVDDGIESWRTRRGQASNIVHVRNIPEDRDESELRLLFEGFSGLVAVNLVRSRNSGASRGHAFVEFATEADAAVLMETKARYSLQLGGQTLHLDYASSSAAMSVSAPTNSTNSLDWICAMCSVVNFARRVECHKCSSARPSNPQRVAAEANAPSAILKVSNLEQRVTDDDLRSLFLAHVSVKDVRIVLDKYTGLPRGLAFVEMFSVGEAARALGLLQGAVPPGGSQPLRLCYARDKFGGSGAPTGTAAGAEALEAAQAMSAYSNWEPKAFDVRALDGTGATDTGSGQGKDGAQKGTTADAASAGSGQQTQGQDQTRAGFVYDQSSGYWYDAASGYYYDANTGLYYHRSTNQWYSYDHTTGQYAAFGGVTSTSNSTGTGGAGSSAAQHSPPDKASETQITTAVVAGPAVRPAQASVAAPKTTGVGAKRTGAVIGAAPVLNAQGLLAAAAIAEEKSKMAQKAAQQQAKQQAAAKAGQPPPRPQAGTPSGAAPAPVQGVIHRGKWAQRAQQ